MGILTFLVDGGGVWNLMCVAHDGLCLALRNPGFRGETWGIRRFAWMLVFADRVLEGGFAGFQERFEVG